jgi:hypothetical protein
MNDHPSAMEKPWYRHALVWLLIAIPLAGMVMAGITATMAYQGADVPVNTTHAAPLSKTSWRGEQHAP